MEQTKNLGKGFQTNSLFDSGVTNDDNWSTAATLGENVDPLALIHYEVRRWRRGYYSLLFDDDDDDDQKVASLDAR